jgi:hypothetical protein
VLVGSGCGVLLLAAAASCCCCGCAEDMERLLACPCAAATGCGSALGVNTDDCSQPWCNCCAALSGLRDCPVLCVRMVAMSAPSTIPGMLLLNCPPPLQMHLAVAGKVMLAVLLLH